MELFDTNEKGIEDDGYRHGKPGDEWEVESEAEIHATVARRNLERAP